LTLDPNNPRLPPDLKGIDDQVEIAMLIATRFRAIEVARSIAENGYFESEPLIGVKVNGTYKVLEGNRRLVALKGLSDESLQQQLPQPEEWRTLGEHAEVPERLPVVVAQSEREAWPIIGYRHVSGIQPWDSFAKSTFIVDRVRGGLSFRDVAALTGERETSVRSHFRNHEIVREADEDFGLDTSRAEESFGIFTRSMNSIALRRYIGAPAPREVEVDCPPVPNDRAKELGRLLVWLFGSDAEDAVIEESRDISDLAAVLEMEASREVLEKTGNLSEAYAATGRPKEGLVRRLETAESVMRNSVGDVATQSGNARVRRLVHKCWEAAQALKDGLS
jgi:hypothetical protein